MPVIRNPAIPGFNPDPSLIRVGDDYYLATSTFEWFGGVMLYHSRDLAHWRMIGPALTRVSQLNLLGVPSSSGIWAPGLSCAHGKFFLVYTFVQGEVGAFNDSHNYLVTADSIEGPWSEPVYLNSYGIDPAMFHDEDGRDYLINTIWDFRSEYEGKAWMMLQEYDAANQTLTGEPVKLIQGSHLPANEGPRMYKRGGYYYLILAEGGTSYGHGVSVFRSKNISGPFEQDPIGQMLTARDRDFLALQKAGHASFVETQNGEWFMAYLCSRPLTPLDGGPDRRCILGRETAIQKVVWTEDGWLRCEEGGTDPQLKSPGPNVADHPFPMKPDRDDFTSTTLDPLYMSLRGPLGSDVCSLSERPGWLSLTGRESLHSLHNQTLLGLRLTTFQARVTTRVDFDAETFQQMAGLTAFYNTRNYFYLRVSNDEKRGRIVGLISRVDGEFSNLHEHDVEVPEKVTIGMRFELNRQKLQFFFSTNGDTWRPIGSIFDATVLSDDFAKGFTGAFAGLCVQDMTGRRAKACFDYLEYNK